MEHNLETEITGSYEERTTSGQIGIAVVGGTASLAMIASGAFETPVAMSAMEAIVSSVLPYASYMVSLSDPIFIALPMLTGFAAVNDSPKAASIAGYTALGWSLYRAVEAYSFANLTLSQAAYAFTASLLPLAAYMVVGGALGLVWLALRKASKIKGHHQKIKTKSKSKRKSKDEN